MAKTRAEIQANYRNSRSLAGETGEQRINTWVSTEAKMALKNIARHSDETQKQTLERLLIQADKEIKDTLSDLDAFDAYIQLD